MSEAGSGIGMMIFYFIIFLFVGFLVVCAIIETISYYSQAANAAHEIAIAASSPILTQEQLKSYQGAPILRFNDENNLVMIESKLAKDGSTHTLWLHVDPEAYRAMKNMRVIDVSLLPKPAK